MDLASVALTTTHGKELLVRDNFILWKYKTFVGKQSTSDYYKCTIQSCLGRLTISEPLNGVVPPATTTETQAHTCNRFTNEEILVKRAEAGIMQAVKEGSKPRPAYDQMAVALCNHPQVSDLAAAQLPQLLQLRRKLNVARSKQIGRPPQSMDAIIEADIPQHLKGASDSGSPLCNYCTRSNINCFNDFAPLFFQPTPFQRPLCPSQSSITS